MVDNQVSAADRLPPLEAVVVFTAVAEKGSFTAAARALGAPLATVSRRVAELEDHLGLQLIARTTRRLSLTDAGARFLAHGRLILETLRQATDEAAQVTSEPTGRLRITMATVVQEIGAGRLLSHFAGLHPKLRCEFDVSDRFVDLVSEGYDLAIRVGSLKDSSLMRRKIGSTEASMYASPELIARNGRPEHPRELAGHALIGEEVVPRDTQSWELLHAEQRSQKIEFRPVVSARGIPLIRDLIRDGQGIGRLPTQVGRPMVEEGTAVPILPEWTGPSLDIAVVYPAQRELLPATRLAIDFLTQEAGRGLVAPRPRP